MTEILEVRDAIVTELGTILPASGESWPIAHAQDLKGVLWHHRRFPSIATTVLSSTTVYTGEILTTVRFAAFCAVKGIPAKNGDPELRRDAGGILLKTAVIKKVAEATDWGTNKASKPHNIKSQNLSNVEVDKHDVNLWVVTWDQQITLDSSVGVDDLHDLLHIHSEIDLDDGQVEAVDDVIFQP